MVTTFAHPFGVRTVTIIGAGTMGTAIAAVVANGGNTVQVLTKDPNKASDAIPARHTWRCRTPAEAEVPSQAGPLDGKVVVDIINPLTSGNVGAETTTVLIAGDDIDAKTALAAVIEAGGLGVDAGTIKRAHELEALGFLQRTPHRKHQDLMDERLRAAR